VKSHPCSVARVQKFADGLFGESCGKHIGDSANDDGSRCDRCVSIEIGSVRLSPIRGDRMADPKGLKALR
jgi:hypothetical protein